MSAKPTQSTLAELEAELAKAKRIAAEKHAEVAAANTIVFDISFKITQIKQEKEDAEMRMHPPPTSWHKVVSKHKGACVALRHPIKREKFNRVDFDVEVVNGMTVILFRDPDNSDACDGGGSVYVDDKLIYPIPTQNLNAHVIPEGKTCTIYDGLMPVARVYAGELIEVVDPVKDVDYSLSKRSICTISGTIRVDGRIHNDRPLGVPITQEQHAKMHQ